MPRVIATKSEGELYRGPLLESPAPRRGRYAWFIALCRDLAIFYVLVLVGLSPILAVMFVWLLVR